MSAILASLESKIRLSDGEKRLLAMLPNKANKISSDKLAKQFYARRHEPFNSRLVVVGMLRHLQKKIDFAKAPLAICNTERAGPYPMEFWLERD